MTTPVTNRFRSLRLLLVLGAAVLPGFLATPETSGITINLVQAPAGSTLTPAYDPNLVHLGNMMQAAANFWQGIILDNHVVTVTYGYLNLDAGTHGLAVVSAHDGQRATAGSMALAIEDNMPGDWFFDPTPTSHTEFSMHQVLHRELGLTAQGLYYDGSPNDVLEVGYWGNYIGPDQGRDALTTTIHELGHILGLSQGLPTFGPQTNDGLYDFNPLFTQGVPAAVHYHGPGADDRDHVRSSDSVMAVGSGNGDRNLPGATDLFALASVSNWTQIDLPRKDFWGNGATNWNAAINWPGNRIPDAQDIVHVRNGSTANLTTSNGQAGNLFVQEGSVVSTGSNTLNVTSTLTVEGVNPGQQANVVVNSNGRVTANTIRLNNGGLMTLTSGVTEEVETNQFHINPGGVLLGNGDVRINNVLVNDGTITAIAGLVGDQINLITGPINLDGASESGEVFAVLGNLRIAANLTDAFDGQMTIGAGREVRKFGSWQFGEGAASDMQLRLQGGNAANAARLEQQTGSVTFAGGTLLVTGVGEVNGSKTFQPGMNVEIPANGDLILNGVTTMNGGSYTGSGILRMGGTINIAENTQTDVAIVDLDGTLAMPTLATLNLNNRRLTINAQQIDEGNNRFDGTLNMSGFLAGLTVNLDDPTETWRMDGELNVSGGTSLTPQASLVGNPVLISGLVEASGVSQFLAPTTLTGLFNTAAASTQIRLANGPHVVENGAVFNGPGSLVVNNNATLLSEDTAVIGINMINRGRFEVGAPIGTVAVTGNFTQEATGTLGIEIAGPPGGAHDRLNVAGTAQLAGTLEVSVVHGFIPPIGQTYTILDAAPRVGSFDTVNILAHDVLTINAVVSYPTNRVTLQFTDISMFGDFNGDLALECADVDALVAEIASGGAGSVYDLNDDGLVNQADLDLWLAAAGSYNVGGSYLPGDANLDGIVDGLDFTIWNAHKFTTDNGWCGGDFSADGITDGVDFTLWNAHKFMSSTDNVAAVPEPAHNAGVAVLLLCLACQRRLRTHRNGAKT